MKKRILPVALVFVFIFLAGCSAKMGPDGFNDVSGSKGELNMPNDNYGYDRDYAPTVPEEPSQGGAVAPDTYEKKIIINASMTVQVKDVAIAYEKFLEAARTNGGYEFSSSKSEHGNSIRITAVFKIAPSKLDTLMSSLRGEGKMLSENKESADVTDEYYDAEIRLDTMRKTLEKYYQFLNDAKSVEDMMKIQAEINRITADIESLTGKLQRLTKDTKEATLEIVLTEEYTPAAQEIKWNSLSFSDMGRLIKNVFLGILNFFVSLLQWLAIIIAGLSPILIIGAVVLFFIIRKKRKNKNKTE